MFRNCRANAASAGKADEMNIILDTAAKYPGVDLE
jgi:hypothetical protein